MKLFKLVTLASAASLVAADAPAQSSAPACGGGSRAGSRILGSLVGGTIGGWVGFVGAKIKLSDWDDASRASSGARMRRQATIGGAAIGAVIGALTVDHSASCKAPSVDTRLGQRAITPEEIANSGQTGSVYDLVYARRRNWLNLRETPAEDQTLNDRYVVAYMDNTRLGTVDELKRIPVTTIQVVRYFDAAQATYRWGGRNPAGAIEVLTAAPTK